MKLINDKKFLEDLMLRIAIDSKTIKDLISLRDIRTILSRHLRNLPKKKETSTGVGWVDPKNWYNQCLKDCEEK